MTRFLIAAPLALALALPAAAQDAEEDGIREAFDLFAEGSRLILENLMEEIGPTLETEVLPLLEGLADQLGDLSGYHPPEILPNGDILIRRRQDPDAPDMPEMPEGDDPVTDPIDL